jgi:hypothetical protein
MYRFKTGKFAGKPMEQVMLRYAPRLYWAIHRIEEEGKERAHVQPLLQHFRRLRHKLRDAPILVDCYADGCQREPKWMTFALDWEDHYLKPGAQFWCDKHGRHLHPDEEGDESEKMEIHFDALREPTYGDKRSQKVIHLAVLEALGIERKPARITEGFASRFFANLR